MGQVIAILMSYDNIYRDDISDSDFYDNQCECTTTNDDEFNLSTASSNYEWHIYNNHKRNTKDYGFEILN